jgi:hypothetical protein
MRWGFEIGIIESFLRQGCDLAQKVYIPTHRIDLWSNIPDGGLEAANLGDAKFRWLVLKRRGKVDPVSQVLIFSGFIVLDQQQLHHHVLASGRARDEQKSSPLKNPVERCRSCHLCSSCVCALICFPPESSPTARQWSP